MDPNVTLARIRELLNRPVEDWSSDDAEEFEEQFRALDRWMSSGGFPPEAWRHG